MNGIAQNTSTGGYNPFTASMVTGSGVHGGPNGSMSYEELVAAATRLADDESRFDWPCLPKTSAQWLLPSVYPSRKAADQVNFGSFAALMVDIDGGKAAFTDVAQAVLAATGGAVALVYSTKSATFSNPRWRVVIPLEWPISGADYADTALALYSLIREASAGRVQPDDAVARPGQISFIPNAPDGDPRGEDYLAFAGEIGDNPDFALDLTDDHPIVRRRQILCKQRHQEVEAAATQAKQRRKGGATLIDRFNARHSIADLLKAYGYDQGTDPSGRWPTMHWRSPYQTSGSYATRLYPAEEAIERWVSLSGSDAKRGLGAKAASGGARFGDAFDLYAHFEHGGDATAALEAWQTRCDDERHMEVARQLPLLRRGRAVHLATLRLLVGRVVKAKAAAPNLSALRDSSLRQEETDK
ncbi:hypothetical protein AB4874_18245 [Thioclava sp. 15-R06ZXC-3]|uniref:Uncharacterized protein n=1 Tax=Thioclava arctica TaxID=3238301 RepID=A0ABV3TRY3_9RHOB